jgi:hypothetical protein
MGELDNGRLRVCADTQTLSPDPGNAGVGIWIDGHICLAKPTPPGQGAFFCYARVGQCMKTLYPPPWAHQGAW